jgi:hypothetical protein
MAQIAEGKIKEYQNGLTRPKHKREVSRTDASGIPTHTYHANATPGSVTNVEEWDVWP